MNLLIHDIDCLFAKFERGIHGVSLEVFNREDTKHENDEHQLSHEFVVIKIRGRD